jgi:glycosyltransferase involved in cell wall biosynthesis
MERNKSMKLLIVMITHNRLDYTKRTLESLLSTINLPYFLIVADNASTDGTQEYLQTMSDKGKINYVILNKENLYPGKATNQAWDAGIMFYPEATHLMRLDNDMAFAPDWDVVVEQYFDKVPKLGQLGLDYGPVDDPDAKYGEEEYNGMVINPYPGNVGGTNIIKREVFDKVRYDESPWSHKEVRPTAQEDAKFSRAISNSGWRFGHSTIKLAWCIDSWEDYPAYYLKTMTDRGYGKIFKRKLDKLKEML